MQHSELTAALKALLVSELNLAGRDPAGIDDEAPLFAPAGSGGLGLDSLDALQIAMLVEDKFGVRVPEGDEARPIFRCVSSLATFIDGARRGREDAAPAVAAGSTAE